jgi:hypothetical protein
MRSAAVILTQHRRSCRPAIQRFERALPRRDVQSRRNLRRNARDGNRGDAGALARVSMGKARSVRRRYRPVMIIPRGFLPLIVH